MVSLFMPSKKSPHTQSQMFRSKSKAHVLEQEKVALERERIALYREKILLERARLERTTPGRFGEYHGAALSPVKQPPPTYLKPVAGLPPPAPQPANVNKVAPRPAPPAPERKTIVPATVVAEQQQQEKPSFRLRARSNSNSSSSFQANSSSFKRLPAVNSSSFRSTASNRRSVDENLRSNNTNASLVESQKRLHLSTATYEEADSWAAEEEKQDRSFCNRSSATTIDVTSRGDNVYTAEAVDTSVEENEPVPIAPFEEEEEMKTVTIVLQVPKSCNVTERAPSHILNLARAALEKAFFVWAKLKFIAERIGNVLAVLEDEVCALGASTPKNWQTFWRNLITHAHTHTQFPGQMSVALHDHRTVLLLDWDNTLLPSSVLLNRMPHSAAPQASDLAELEAQVVCFLSKALILGPVLLVTNSETGWVELSCQRYLPNVLPLLPFMKIVSARSRFEFIHPDKPTMWKFEAFREELLRESSCSNGLALNVISVGDSLYERDAVYMACQELLLQPLIKSIKLIDEPEVKELTSQLIVLHKCIDDVIAHANHLDLWLNNVTKNGITDNNDEENDNHHVNAPRALRSDEEIIV